MSSLALNLTLRKVIPINIIGLLTTSMVFVTQGVLGEEVWTRTEPTLYIPNSIKVEELRIDTNIILASLMKHIDIHLIENIMALFVRIEEISKISMASRNNFIFEGSDLTY